MKSKTYDKIATAVLYIVAISIIFLLVVTLAYIFFKGLSHVSWSFLTTPPKSFEAGGGIGPQIFNSFVLLILSMLITIPFGLGTGIYLAEYAKPSRITNIIRLCVETLASLPSIVVGLFGLIIFVNMTGWGYTLLGGALTVTVLNLPVMTRVCETSIRNVGNELKEASLGLGATKWQTIYRVILPVALPGIITGVILTSGRVFGEAAAILYTAGMSSTNVDFGIWDPTSPRSPLSIMRPAETLSVHIWKVNSESLLPDTVEIANASSAVLVGVVLIFNLAARRFGRFIHARLSGER